MKFKPITFIAALGLYLISTGISYATFTYFQTDQSKLVNSTLPKISPDQQRIRVNLTAPKTAECSLNGKFYTEAEKDIWSTRRPLGIMIENHIDSRPQSGLSRADIIYEAVAEGGITRFMGIYLCGASAEDIQIGPVRSTRTYFIDWISEYGISPLYTHVGGANCNARTGSGCQNGAKADALGQIRKYGWQNYNDINQFSVGFPTFWRDYDRLGKTVATEHTMYSTTDKLWEIAAKRGLTYTDEDNQLWDKTYIPWKFTETENEISIEKGNIAPSYNFWNNNDSTNYYVSWKYDPQNNQYLRFNGGKPHIDLNTKKQLTAKNIVVLSMIESRANDGYPKNVHLLYKNKGKGAALIFKNGQVIKGNWNKKTRTDRTIFTDKTGKEIQFNRGLIWISILPTGKKIEY